MKNKIFYEGLKISIETLMTLLSQREAQIKATNPQYTDALSQHLKVVHVNVMSAFTRDGNVVKCSFNFEPLVASVNVVQQKKYPDIIVQAVNDLYQTILADIQTPSTNNQTDTQEAKLEGGHFYYQGISAEKAAEIINTLSEQDSITPAGEMLWRVCLGLNPAHANEFVEKYAKLIDKIRQLPSYQSYQLFKLISHEFVLSQPWLLAFFTVDQLTDFIAQPLSDQAKKHDTIQKLMATVNYDSEHSSSIEKPFFQITQGMTPDQYLLKKSLIRFIISHRNYSRGVVNESVSEHKFIWSCGVIKEFLTFVNSTTIINLFLKMEEAVLKLMKFALDDKQPTNANDLRAFPEYTWLQERIIQDLGNGDDDYFAKVITIPYILYYLVAIPEFYKIPNQKLVGFFSRLSSKLILKTLGLLDEYDQSVAHCSLELGTESYPVNKKFINQIYVNLATFLLSDELLNLRARWLQNEADQEIFIYFPFLLKGLQLNETKDFIYANITKITENAKNCFKNGVNPYLNCPLLLAYLDTDEIIRLYNQHAGIRAFFEGKAFPMEVVIEYIKRGMIEKLISAIPSLIVYLQPEHLNQVNPTLLDESLLTAMTKFETTRQLLKNYPSILDRFSKQVISACAQVKAASFLRLVLRQNILIHLLLDNFDDLIDDENFGLMKSMVRALYRNPETEAIVSKIEQRLQTMRDEIYKRYDSKAENELIILAEKKLIFDVLPYSFTETFSEQNNVEEIKKIAEDHYNVDVVDPVICVLKNMINTSPSWTSRFIHSGGCYPALKQYCLYILSISVEKLKSNGDDYPAIYQSIYQYAVLKLEEGEYEEAAESFIKYINYLGVNDAEHGNVFHYLFMCANKLAESKITQAKSLYYYRYLALTLLAKSPIQPIRAKRYWCEMTLELATKSYDLIQKDMPEIERLALILSIHELLTQATQDNFWVDNLSEKVMALKNQFITTALKQFQLSFSQLYTKLIQTTNQKKEELSKKRSESTPYPDHRLDNDKFLNDLSDLYRRIPRLIQNGILLSEVDQITSGILTQLQLGIEAYNSAYHATTMPSIKTLIERRMAIRTEVETRGTFALIKKRLENLAENDDQNTIEFPKTITTFSPHNQMREIKELEQLNILLNLPKSRSSNTLTLRVSSQDHQVENNTRLSVEQENLLKKSVTEEIERKRTLSVAVQLEKSRLENQLSQVPAYLDEEEMERKAAEKAQKKSLKLAKQEQANREAQQEQEEIRKKQEEQGRQKQLAQEQEAEEKKRLEEDVSKKLAYQSQMQEEEEALRQREQEEKAYIMKALEKAKEKELKHKIFFEQQDSKIEAEKKAKEQRKSRHYSARSSARAPTFSDPNFISMVESNNENIIGPGAPIQQAPAVIPTPSISWPLLAPATPKEPVTRKEEDKEDKEALVLKILMIRRSIAMKKEKLEQKNRSVFLPPPQPASQPEIGPEIGTVITIESTKLNQP